MRDPVKMPDFSRQLSTDATCCHKQPSSLGLECITSSCPLVVLFSRKLEKNLKHLKMCLVTERLQFHISFAQNKKRKWFRQFFFLVQQVRGSYLHLISKHRTAYNTLSYDIPFTGKHEPNKLTCSPLCDFIAQLVRALHRHRRGHGFESR